MTGTGAPAASGPQMLLGLGIDEVQEQVRVWSVPTTIGWAVSAVLVTALSFVVPR